MLLQNAVAFDSLNVDRSNVRWLVSKLESVPVWDRDVDKLEKETGGGGRREDSSSVDGLDEREDPSKDPFGPNPDTPRNRFSELIFVLRHEMYL